MVVNGNFVGIGGFIPTKRYKNYKSLTDTIIIEVCENT